MSAFALGSLYWCVFRIPVRFILPSSIWGLSTGNTLWERQQGIARQADKSVYLLYGMRRVDDESIFRGLIHDQIGIVVAGPSPLNAIVLTKAPRAGSGKSYTWGYFGYAWFGSVEWTFVYR